MENLLIAENIRSFFPEAGPFSLTIHAGDRCHVQGSSRSCNALFEIFTGLRKPDEGSVTVRGKNVYEMSETERAAFRRDSIGAVPKGGGFLPELILLEQVRLPMVLGGLSRDEIQNRIRKNAFDYLFSCKITKSKYNGTKSGNGITFFECLNKSIFHRHNLLLQAGCHK